MNFGRRPPLTTPASLILCNACKRRPGYLPRRRRRGWRRTAHILGGSSSGTALSRPPIRARPAQPEARAVFVGGKRHQMAWRLGKVLYWLSCIGAVFVAGTGVAIYVAAGAKNDGLILMGVLLGAPGGTLGIREQRQKCNHAVGKVHSRKRRPCASSNWLRVSG